MSRRSRRKKRRAVAAKRGYSRGRGRAQRIILLNPPGASSEEVLRRLFMCIPRRAIEHWTEEDHAMVREGARIIDEQA